ncbi:Adenylosuccinate synthase [Neonectria magnoliae]|uniref:Adenylosuccinate synthase n=1 Tax=Neonectria magnoliae TaxID=2732573 RepID=A0ABR1I633_9HYPO
MLTTLQLDVLDAFETIEVAIAYRDLETGEVRPYARLNNSEQEIENARVEHADHQRKAYNDLPKQARDYVEYIENFIGVKVKWIDTGPDREAMIRRT